ncbi:MCM-domain-containing protein [Rozella allomycis CSF55]|uniref:DNA replication licensing factor MCM3 n=1 Tax=Rozella allomycis (strain CSF55) TaxID=988480 RepID=A0A075AVQ8_ROZAC|nr:Nucleic acid-binding domain-containing protein [Rozella allomycis CSF55]RKP18832.1 MCM-domain-containing protein [Rozella allomycis CSF55]|eukprot:EPZ34230.1 Nucleic acid-binding domain-containing protein [Rozella allomycis CSF55]
MQTLDEQFQAHSDFFRQFLDNQSSPVDGPYINRIRSIVESILKDPYHTPQRFVFNLNELRSSAPEQAKNIVQNPVEYYPPFVHAVNELANSFPETALQKVSLSAGFEGTFGEMNFSPRSLNSSCLGKMVSIEGIVTSCSLVRPKMLKSAHYEPNTKTFYVQEYRDSTMLGAQGVGTSRAYPRTDEAGNVLKTVYSLSKYKEQQTVTIQEMPEKAPAGQLPRSIDVMLDEDLVDRVKPGDRVQIIGIYRAAGSSFNGIIPGVFRTIVLANNVKLIGKDVNQTVITDKDIQNIKKMGKRRDIFEIMSKSLAPSIYGHEYIKKALLLFLLGGFEKNLENGTHLRGDINIMMVGDPSTAKSQLLRFVLNIAPLAIATTGRGSSGVGLTAAVVSDKETGERRLEAGAMVLADRGIVCIDEFDKMSEVDRVAIHEVMEQQTVTIAKAGIHATLNARCSVLAAANPVFGQYRENLSPQDNIRLPDSLLSRFDLMFIVLDEMNPNRDREISSHVLNMHRYLPPGVDEGTPLDESVYARDELDDDVQLSETPVFQKYNNKSEDNSEFLSVPFIKRYIHYAKARVVPILTKEASEFISNAYAEFRQKREDPDQARTFPVTPRTLETLIRLATAHAKIRLSSAVEKKDAKIAVELIEFCLYKKVIKNQKKKKKNNVHSSDEEDANIEEDDDDEFAITNVTSRLRSQTIQDKTQSTAQVSMEQGTAPIKSSAQSTVDEFSLPREESQPFTGETLPRETQDQSTMELDLTVSTQTMNTLLDALNQVKEDSGVSVTLDELMEKLKGSISLNDVKLALTELERDNKIMFRDDMIFFIS